MMITQETQEQSKPARNTDNLKRTLKTEASSAVRALGEARDVAIDKAADVASEAKEAAVQRAGELQKVISASLQTYAEAVEKACEQLDNKSDATASRLVREAANGLRKCSDTLASKPFEQVLDDLRSYGRQYPAALIGGSVLAGLVLGRLSRSSQQNMSASNNEGFEAGSAGSGTDEAQAFDRVFESEGTSR
jgi:hypothetical protein